MVNPKDVLTPKELAQYRTVRIVAGCFTLFGSVSLMAWSFLAYIALTSPATSLPSPEIAAICGVIIVSAVCGVTGGIGTLLRSRRWSKPAYFTAVCALFGVPVGTFFGVVFLSGISGYLRSCDRLRAATLADEGLLVGESVAANPDDFVSEV